MLVLPALRLSLSYTAPPLPSSAVFGEMVVPKTLPTLTTDTGDPGLANPRTLSRGPKAIEPRGPYDPTGANQEPFVSCEN